MELLKSSSLSNDIVDTSALTIGTFDGMHLGHIHLIENMLTLSKKNDSPSVVITFNPNPFIVLNNLDKSKYHLINNIKRFEILESLGVDYLCEIEFDNSLAQLSAYDFLSNFIINPFNPKDVVIGYDHHFGRGREGNSSFLDRYSSLHNYSLKVVEAYKINGDIISSSLIRSLIQSGDILRSKELLGYNYSLRGTVVKGNSIGREIGFPTANIDVKSIEQIFPQNGVYLIKSKINEDYYHGMCNIGYKPTLTSGDKMSIEVHFFNYNKFDLYNKKLDIEFVDYVRSERKFENIEDLKLQLSKDRDYCRKIER